MHSWHIKYGILPYMYIYNLYFSKMREFCAQLTDFINVVFFYKACLWYEFHVAEWKKSYFHFWFFQCFIYHDFSWHCWILVIFNVFPGPVKCFQISWLSMAVGNLYVQSFWKHEIETCSWCMHGLTCACRQWWVDLAGGIEYASPIAAGDEWWLSVGNNI